MVKGIDHIGILVKNVDETARLCQELFGAKLGEAETVPEQGVKIVPIEMDGARLEIMEPLPGSAMEKTLEKRGPGLHHIAFAVDDVDKELGSLTSKGVTLIDKKARHGLWGMIGFIHPKSVSGVLTELTKEFE